MPRKPRVFVAGGTYHVYCRAARGERCGLEVKNLAAMIGREACSASRLCAEANRYQGSHFGRLCVCLPCECGSEGKAACRELVLLVATEQGGLTLKHPRRVDWQGRGVGESVVLRSGRRAAHRFGVHRDRGTGYARTAEEREESSRRQSIKWDTWYPML